MNNFIRKKTRLQVLREKVQQGGEDKQKILDKAVKYILNPKYGTLEKKYHFLINNLGLTESEYKQCFDKASENSVFRGMMQHQQKENNGK
jgi:hypothetical protein